LWSITETGPFFLTRISKLSDALTAAAVVCAPALLFYGPDPFIKIMPDKV
jgi:hypothetical protein